jgi:hypothetical protein
MNFPHSRIKPILLSCGLAGAAVGISALLFGGDASRPVQPKQAVFQVKNEFKVQVPKGAKTVRMWFAVPQEDSASVIRELTVTADFPVHYFRDDWGNRVLPPLLKGFKAVPPLITDINLSLDDRFLYISCWGTGEFLQYDVSDPFHPKKTGSVHLGGIVRRAAHPKNPGAPLNGGPQMVEVSRDGRRVYFTNSLYSPWDAQFYPDGIRSWMVKLDAKPEGGMALDPKFLLEFGDLRGHQVHLEGGDASSDSYCYS